MSLVRTGHQPDDWRNEGPGAAGGVDGLAAVSRLTAFVDMVAPLEAGANAPIERRQASEAERDAWRRKPAAELDRRPRFAYSRDEIRERAHRGGEVNRQRVAAARAGLVTLVDPPVLPEEVRAMSSDPIADQLAELEAAAHEALGTRVRQQEADALWRTGRRTLRDALAAAQRVLAAEDAPEPPKGSNGAAALAQRAPAAADPAGLTIGQRRVLDALVRHAGDRDAVASELGQKRASIDTATAVIRQSVKVRGFVLEPAEVAAVARRRAR